MTTIDEPVAGTPCWMDAAAPTLEAHHALQRFLTDLYGWSWSGDDQASSYATAMHDGSPVMGLFVDPEAPSQPTVYFATMDTAASVARVHALGGQVTVEPVRVLDLGWTTIVTDPVGATHGLWEPEVFAGFGRMYEPGAPGWFDHVSGDGDLAARYYVGLTGHSVIEPEPGLRILQHDGGWFASVTQPQVAEEVPRWNPVFVVDELPRTLDVVRRHGGQVLVEEMPVPGTSISVFRDPVVGSVMTVMAAGAPA
ncbi:MAG: VOC family protein [Acidimicrobiales bacterium]